MKRRWRLWLACFAVLLLLAWFWGPWTFYFLRGWIQGVIPRPGDDPPFSHPLAKVEEDTRSPFHIDPKKPYRIEFGRGSGLYGLDTVKINEEGTVVLHRQQGTWYTATIQLPPESLTKVLQAVEDNHLLGLHRAYHANVADGAQWVLWIKQGDEEKSVSFNNHFPKEIVRFANSLDAILSESGSGSLTWYPDRRGDHAKELWDREK
jgi:hypothetical protein